MDKVFSWLFSGRGLTPHGICLSWRPELIWLNVGSDAIIALCYFSIPVALAAFAVRRRDIAYRWVFWCFAAFITACGATHLMSIWTLWIPDYDAEAVLKGLTAAASIWTATALWVLFPAALKAPSAAQLLQANLDLSARVRERDQAMAALVERNRLLVLAEEMAQAGHWRLELPGHRRVWSEGIHRIFGVDSADGPPAFLDAANGYHPEDRDRVMAVFEASLQTGEPFSLETRIQRPSGEERIIVVRGVCERVAGQTPTSLFGVSLDRTDAKRLEGEKEATRLIVEEARSAAEKARAEAEAASLAKSEFLATMSHEIRTPLNAVIGYSDRILESGCLADLDRRSAEIVKSSGEALLTIVNDVLDFSRIEAGKLELRPAAFDLERLIEDAMAMVADAAQRKRLDLRRVRRAPLPDFVLGDADRLRQVLLNLLNNAVKFTQGGSIVLTCEPTADGGSVRFEVEDQGIGIAPDRTDLLFQRFTQVDGTISRRFGGSGLGLAISKALVTLMAGDIGVTSVEGEGSTFWFEVPLPTAQRQRDEARSPAIASTHAGRILVVEDVAINRELARAVVSSGGFEVDVASDGEEAVGLAGSRDYDVILMDVQMPGMDGLTAARRIAEHEGPRGAVPILGMTANVLPAQIAALRAAGMVGHIGKPFRKPELLASLAQAMAATAGRQPERRPTSEVSLV